MDQTVITIIAIFLAAILMFVFPLLSTSEMQEKVTQTVIQEATTEFVNQAATIGKITQNAYDTYVQKLGATGNTYDIEIEVQHIDENPGKKGSASSKNLIGENVYYSTFTSEILGSISNTKSYSLKKGDNIIVNVKNTNMTVAQILRNFFYSMTGNGTYQVGASYAQMVVNTGTNN